MTWALVNAAKASTGRTVTITGVTAGNLLIAVLFSGSSANGQPPAWALTDGGDAWNAFDDSAGGHGCSEAIYWKVAESSGDYTLTWNGASSFSGSSGVWVSAITPPLALHRRPAPRRRARARR